MMQREGRRGRKGRASSSRLAPKEQDVSANAAREGSPCPPFQPGTRRKTSLRTASGVHLPSSVRLGRRPELYREAEAMHASDLPCVELRAGSCEKGASQEGGGSPPGRGQARREKPAPHAVGRYGLVKEAVAAAGELLVAQLARGRVMAPGGRTSGSTSARSNCRTTASRLP